ncbi:hypothetical protein LCGC14_2846720, partial [marine sediment metagenome]
SCSYPSMARDVLGQPATLGQGLAYDGSPSIVAAEVGITPRFPYRLVQLAIGRHLFGGRELQVDFRLGVNRPFEPRWLWHLSSMRTPFRGPKPP